MIVSKQNGVLNIITSKIRRINKIEHVRKRGSNQTTFSQLDSFKIVVDYARKIFYHVCLGRRPRVAIFLPLENALALQLDIDNLFRRRLSVYRSLILFTLGEDSKKM